MLKKATIAHTLLEDDGTPTQEDIDRLDEKLRNFAQNTQNIFSEEEDSTPISNVGRENNELAIGMVWTNIFEARKFIRNYAIINKFEYYQVKNEDYRLRYKCGDEKSWNAWTICMERIVGSYDEGYIIMPKLTVQVLLANPGSISTCNIDLMTNEWTGTCISYKGSMEGCLIGCRPLLGLDGCFLKGKYGGVCLSIIGLDGNNGLFPIAVFFCRSECTETWKKFLEMMEPYLNLHRHRLNLISDRQKGLIEVVSSVFPFANHRFCFRNMYKNMKKYHRGSHLEKLVWGDAKAWKQTKKKEFLDQLKLDDPAAYDWLHREPYER
ncbi:hypothetical protein GIB67_021638 [Kingdonia uniflora]|uniref:MULE transposase domain-containing protein n=1 Tax=Kingdonia uniflora TaxID=39325 RepID=A0A7J7KY36_9MAGN|nr:hypothetical protein GIB67_021638 [Kingdonia uniflora]